LFAAVGVEEGKKELGDTPSPGRGPCPLHPQIGLGEELIRVDAGE